MKVSTIIVGVIAIAAIAVIVILGRGHTTNTGSNSNQPATTTTQTQLPEAVTNSDVKISSPQPGDTVVSPLTVSGEARGTWFFEAVLPIKITDVDGNVIASGQGQAQSDWMTSDFVPFSATLSWSGSVPDVGYLVIAKDNPSGLPQTSSEVKVPLRFGASDTNKMNVSVYFGKDIVGTDIIACDVVYEVSRLIPHTQAVARAALEELLSGPTQQEINNRYTTSIPEGTELNSIRVENGTAYVDFNSRLNAGGGSCSMEARRTQIEKTLTQFPTVDNVVISVNGDTENVLQP